MCLRVEANESEYLFAFVFVWCVQHCKLRDSLGVLILYFICIEHMLEDFPFLVSNQTFAPILYVRGMTAACCCI